MCCYGNNSNGDTNGDGICDDDDGGGPGCLAGDADGDGICDDDDFCYGNNATGDSDGDGICDDNDICQGNDALGDPDGDVVGDLEGDPDGPVLGPDEGEALGVVEGEVLGVTLGLEDGDTDGAVVGGHTSDADDSSLNACFSHMSLGSDSTRQGCHGVCTMGSLGRLFKTGVIKTTNPIDGIDRVTLKEAVSSPAAFGPASMATAIRVGDPAFDHVMPLSGRWVPR